MNVFRLIRRALWSIMMALCIVVACVYLAFSQVFLAPGGLAKIVKQSSLASNVRNDIILPQILSLTKSSQYAGLLDDKTVTDSFNAAVSDDTINNKLTPAIESVSSWLNSKEPDVTFSVSMSDLSSSFADQLSNRVSTKIATLPTCTYRNTQADAENGVCRSPLLTSQAVSKEINDTIKNNPALGQSVAVTPESFPALSSKSANNSNLPSYLNMLYSLSLVSAGLIVLVGIWLLFKHRLGGIVTLGAACIMAAIGLFVVAQTLSHFAAQPSSDSLMHNFIVVAIQSLRTVLDQQIQWLALGGIIAVVLASALIIILHRRRKSRETMHMSRPTPTPET